jgi:uncharacterized membrane-anchored protein
MNNYLRAALAALSFLIIFPSIAKAQEQDNSALFKAMHPQKGRVELANGIVTLNIGPKFEYLNSADATTMITKIMHNPPGSAEGNLGMILPTSQGERWFAIVSYSADGHVPDNDAASANYDDLLKQMKVDTEKASKERRDGGFPGTKLLGWAQRPYYDSATKKIYWARSIQFDDTPDPTLNYDVRILGRTGFLNLKIVDSMGQLEKINAEMPEILSMANFTPGNTYSDYVQSTDHTAAYGIAGLVAGGILAKVGFFKGLLLLAAAFWKIIAVAVLGFFAAVGNFFRKLIGRKPAQ